MLLFDDLCLQMSKGCLISSGRVKVSLDKGLLSKQYSFSNLDLDSFHAHDSNSSLKLTFIDLIQEPSKH